MSTVIRPELSESNKYWISRQRYYELKHFCLQYCEWKKALEDISVYPRLEMDGEYVMIGEVAKPVEECVELRERYLARMRIIEEAAKKADPDLEAYILIGVTEGVSYDYLYSRLEIPCCKDTYYDRYRRFFWILDQTRN